MAAAEPSQSSRSHSWNHLWYDRKTIDPTLFRDDDVFVKVWLKSIENITDLGFDYGKEPDPYVTFQILDSKNGTPDQKQWSSIQPTTLNPEWSPAELFSFVLPKSAASDLVKLIIKVAEHDTYSQDEDIGCAVVALNQYYAAAERQEVRLNLHCPRTNKTLASVLKLEILVTDKFGYMSENEQVFLEFERWDAVKGWGKEGHLYRSSDPPPFCTVDGSFGSNNESEIVAHFDERARARHHVPVSDWTMTHHYRMEGSKCWMYRTTTHITDFLGWDWHATTTRGCNVRRRIHHRITRLDERLVAETGRDLLCRGLW